MTQSALLRVSGRDYLDLMLENNWPFDDSLAHLVHQIEWDMTAQIESTASEEDINDPTNWHLLLEISVAWPRRFNFAPTKNYKHWKERADQAVPGELKTWPKVTHEMCRFGNRVNCLACGGWGPECMHRHYNEKEFVSMIEEGPTGP